MNRSERQIQRALAQVAHMRKLRERQRAFIASLAGVLQSDGENGIAAQVWRLVEPGTCANVSVAAAKRIRQAVDALPKLA
jgi:hypothetical protein